MELSESITLKNIIFRFKWRISFTFCLVILESLLSILYPLLIGYAINDLLKGSYHGIMQLGLLGVCSLVVGSGRRFYDTRVYSAIYRQICPEMVAREYVKNSSISKIVARSSLLTEFVKFLENSMPEVIRSIVSLVGIIILIATLNLDVFYACLALFSLMMVVYTITGKFNYKLNEKYNNQLERQVQILESKDISHIKNYYQVLMKWNVQLSDLETINFIILWIGIIALFLFTPIAVIGSGVLEYGLIFSILMYVFEYIDSVISFPLYIQQLIRLHEISTRLSE